MSQSNQFELSLLAPAKLNLMLHIVGRDNNGYHQLQTVFQLLDFGDELHFSQRDDQQISFTCSVAELETHDNLVLRAIELMRPLANRYCGLNIHLDKQLPIGGGIGGGSSDCATCLLALNRIWDCRLSIEQLAEIGLKLGADVPLFIHGHTAWAEGIGEQLVPVKLESLWYLVIYPECFVSTAEIFSAEALTRNCEISTIRDFLAEGGPRQGLNVMQPVVVERYPQVKEALDWLQQFCPNARMTGSGSCVFAPFDNKAEVSKIALRCRWPHFVARGIDRSPTIKSCV